MSRVDEFAEAWAAALNAWLERRDEAALANAYLLGRRALNERRSLVELAHLHARAVESSSASDVRPATRFLAEALGPPELALQGYREAIQQLRELNATLERRVEERGRELARTELLYRQLVEQLPVVTYSASGRPDEPMRFFSPQLVRLTGFPESAWRKLPGRWGGRLHPEDEPRVIAELERAAASGQPFRAEYRLLRADESIAWIRDEARWVEVDGERLQQGIWLDVTEQRMLEEGVRQAQKMDAIGRLAAAVAHDFNNVLTAILSFSRFVAEDLGAEHPSAADMQEVLRAATRGASLTRQLLAFSRQNTFRPGPVDAGEVAAEMEKMLQKLLGDRVSLRVKRQQRLYTLHADRSHVEQIILNLVVNAGDAITDTGVVTVEVSNAVLETDFVHGQLRARPGEYVCIAVSDTGVGMDAATQARIFEPFFTTKAKGKGTGLGLATVYGIVRQMGGDIAVYSAPNRGTTFKIFLPRSFEEQHEAAPPEPTEAPRGNETVLLAEDDPAVREAAVRALQRSGFHVIETGDVPGAIERLRENLQTIDLLVTDVILGAGTGPELYAEAQRLRPGLPVLFMSGYTEGALESHGLAPSPEAFIDKPFTPQALVKKVRALLDRPRALF
ncbi:MAG: response regulator [Myxococcaceae bacterium]|nr:response regulator [Myxococcaceae bacterium]